MTSQVNKAGTDWLVLKAQIHTIIQEAHTRMEQPLSIEQYNFWRGQIAMARDLIEWVEPTAPPQTQEEDYGISDPNQGNYA